ncbi:hypothetical protein Goshw_013430, partial [Gossypium schwendimanii]|nr:hypothetical protein [Gossypium schwendimanii]
MPLLQPSLTSKPSPPYLNHPIIHSTINNLDQKMFGKHLRRAHLVQALKKKWFLPEKRRTEEWEVKIEQVVDIKRFVQNNGGRVIGIVESIKRERVRGRVKEGWEKRLFGR